MRSFAASATLAVCLVLLAHGAQAAADAKPLTGHVIPVGPIRKDWTFAHGYCGELSIQQTALYHGAWVGQEAARQMGGSELLLGYNLEKVVDKLGFRSAKWTGTYDEEDTEEPSAYLQQYMVFMKQNLLRNFTVIFGSRIEGGEDPEYDHIMPALGVYMSKAPGSAGSAEYDPLDELVWMNDYGQVIRRAMGAKSFFAPADECQISDAEGGCFSSDTKTYAVAMGPLRDAYNVFRPLRMSVTGWSDGSIAMAEPLVAKKAQANYALDLKDSRLKPGETFTLFRCDGAGSLPRDPKTIRDVKRASKCKASAPQTMRAGLVLTEKLMGKINSNSVVYFAVVPGK